MDERTRAEAVMGTEQAFRDALKASVSILTNDPAEQMQIASGVVALMLRKLYQEHGREWLEAVITQAMA